MGLVAATVMSATTFAGSAQFAVATILDDGGTVIAAILAAVFLNARYIAIGVSVASIVPGRRVARFVEAQLIVDESWALSGRERPVRVADPRRRRALPVRALGGCDCARCGCGRGARGSGRAWLRRSVRRPLPRARGALPPEQAGAPSRRARRRDHADAAPGRARGRPDRRRLGGLPPGASSLSHVWTIVMVVGAATMLFKAAGPVFLGRRPLPPRVAGSSSCSLP